jgi:hypothetical protein
MTPGDVIADVRVLINDTRSPYRNSDNTLLGFVNQTIRRMAMLRPDLFTSIVDITTTPNVNVQTLPSNAVRLVEIFQVKGGTAIEEVDRDTFNRAYPQWTTDPAGVPTKYMRHPRNPRAYFLYPRPSTGTVVIGEYVITPNLYTINDVIQVLPDAYFSTLVDGVMFLTESIDDEHVLSGRAKMFMDSFTQGLGVGLQSRVVTDTEDGGIMSSSSRSEG